MYMLLMSSYPMGLSIMLYDQSGSDKSNMVAFKLEVPTSKLVDKIGTKFQRYYICFRGTATKWDYKNAVQPNRK